MDESTTRIILIIVGMLTVYAVLAAVVLFLGGRFSSVGNRQDLAARLRRLHILAFLAFLVGVGLAWMAFESDHPSKEKHLLLPIIFVAVVYGYPIFLELKALAFAWGSHLLQRLFRRP